MKNIIVVLPTYNEKDNIEEMVSLVLNQQKNIPDFNLEVLIADSHSPDGTLEISQNLAKKNSKIHVLDVVERGIGVGCIKGHEYAIKNLGADILVQMDADLSHNPVDIPKMIEKIKEGYDLVLGSRLIPGGANKLQWHRRLFSFGASLYCRLVLGLWSIHDFTPSFRTFTKELFLKIDKDKIPWQSKTFIYQPAFIYAAVDAGANFTEVPIIFIDRRKGRSKAKIVQYIFEIIKFGIKIRLKKSVTLIKFGIVGFIGFLVNAGGLEIFYRLGFHPGLAAAFGAEFAIISNFTWNNLWTFKKETIYGWRIPWKFLQFNLSSVGAIIIQGLVVGGLSSVFGAQWRQIYLVVAVGFFVMPFNYAMYNIFIWKRWKIPFLSKFQKATG